MNRNDMYRFQAETFKDQFNTSLFSPCHFDQQYPDGGPSTKQHEQNPSWPPSDTEPVF